MRIWKIALLTLVKRKRMFILLTTVVSFSILITITLSATIEGINRSMLEKAYLNYGEHHVIMHDITEKDKEYIGRLEEVDRFSEYALVGTTNINSNKLDSPETLGWIDSSALDLGRINLIEGRLPLANNEVAIESFYANRGSVKKEVGTTLNIKVGDKKEVFTIVGIVSDYSMNWATSPSVVKGVNDFPNVLLYKEDLYDFGDPTYHALVKFNGSLERIENSSYLISDNLQAEEKAVNEFLFRYLATMKTTQNIAMLFQVFLLITSTVCMVFVFNLYYFNYRKKISIFQAFGASKSQILLIVLLQCLAVFFLGMLIAIPCSFFLSYVMTHLRLGEATPFLSILKGNSLKLIIWLSLVFLSVVGAAVFPLKRKPKRSTPQTINAINKYTLDCFSLTNRGNFLFLFNYLSIQIRSSLKHTLLIILTLSLGTILMFLGQVVAKEVTGISDNPVDFYMNSQIWMSDYQYYGFPVPVSQGPIFDSNELEELEQTQGIEYVDKRPISDGVSLLLTNRQLNSSPFLTNWVNDYQFPDYTNGAIPSREKLGISEKTQTVPNVDYIILNDNELEILNEQYFEGELNTFSFKHNPLAIIFLPIQEELDEALGISSGDNIKIGQINKFSSSEAFIYKEWDFTVADIIPSRFLLKINESIEKDSSRVTIVFHQDVNRDLDIFRGFSEVFVYLNDQVNTNEQMDIEIKTKEIVSSIPGSLYESINNLSNEEKANSKFIRALSLFIFVSTVSFSIISIVAVVYGRFLLKQREWGILRALGITKKQMNIMFFLEVAFYVVISNILVLIFVVFILLTQALYGNGLLYFNYFLLSILIVYFFAIVAVIVLLKLINKINLSTLIRSIV